MAVGRFCRIAQTTERCIGKGVRVKKLASSVQDTRHCQLRIHRRIEELTLVRRFYDFHVARPQYPFPKPIVTTIILIPHSPVQHQHVF